MIPIRMGAVRAGILFFRVFHRKEVFQITRAVQHPNYHDTILGLPIEDEVFANRETPQSWSKFLSSQSHAWYLGKALTRLVNGVEDTVCGIEAIFCDIDPDFEQIALGLLRLQWERHYFCPDLAAKTLRPSALISSISSGEVSPRSACATPTAISLRNSSRRIARNCSCSLSSCSACKITSPGEE